MTRDRRQALLASTQTNGIDFVEVGAGQTGLRVHFLNAVPLRGLLAATDPVTITGGEIIATVPVNPVDEATDWSADEDGRPVLRLSVPFPGDFSGYTLSLATQTPASGVPVLDPFFAAAAFTFKVNCPATLDCAATAGPAVMAAPPLPAIDYLAKDFTSFRQALSGFSALRYPGWAERSEADLGVVLLEALCAVADDLSYYQDRVAAEATLDTATQAVSILRHARLVDYEPAPATVATTVLQVDVTEPAQLPSGLRVSTADPGGQAIVFEIGTALADLADGTENVTEYQVDPRWNRYGYVGGMPETGPGGAAVLNLQPYWWDDSGQILPAGSAVIWVAGAGFGFTAGQRLVLHTDGTTSADPPVRELFTLSGGADAPAETQDQLYAVRVTRLTFTPPLTADHDLARSYLMGNLVDAVQGTRVAETFVIPPVPPATPAPVPAVTRTGHDWTPEGVLPDYRYTLGLASAVSPAADSGQPGAVVPAGLAWLPGGSSVPTLGDAVVPARPEIVLTATDAEGVTTPWLWRRSLLDVTGPEQDTPVFTLTPERYSPVARIGSTVCFDYDGDDGTTIRFGDGTFGQIPAPGTIFSVVYRDGAGATGNVAADTITNVAPGQPAAAPIAACGNPFPAEGGADAESPQQVRDRAPEQFRSRPLRAVRPEDYVSAAQSLPWVAQAGTVFRWTGSWLAAYTTANPSAAEEIIADQQAELTALLNRRRLAGYQSYVLSPRYLSVDLEITVVAAADRFRGDVAAAVLSRLRPGPGNVPLPGPGAAPPGSPRGSGGFFDHSAWRFGVPLRSSALAAAVQGVPGVVGVTSLRYRRRGVQPDFVPLPDVLEVAPDQILRVDNDPSRPEAGSLTVIVEGGK